MSILVQSTSGELDFRLWVVQPYDKEGRSNAHSFSAVRDESRAQKLRRTYGTFRLFDAGLRPKCTKDVC